MMLRMNESFPILEFDPDPIGIFQPRNTVPGVEVPRTAVACYFADLVGRLKDNPDAEPIMKLPSGAPLWRLRRKDQWVGIFYPGQGAPLAAVCMERVIAAGCTGIVGCGDAGTLTGSPLGDVVVVDSAVRDEGTSYHYLPPSREVALSPGDVRVLAAVLSDAGVAFSVGKTWTTDGLFRETKGKIAQRRQEGCVVVEMETAALAAVASFRSVRFGQYLYSGDDLSEAVGEDRGRLEAADVREQLLRLAIEAALRLIG